LPQQASIAAVALAVSLFEPIWTATPQYGLVLIEICPTEFAGHDGAVMVVEKVGDGVLAKDDIFQRDRSGMKIRDRDIERQFKRQSSYDFC
jgi:hypothetical protein